MTAVWTRALRVVACVLTLTALVAHAQAKDPYQPRIDKDGWEILFDGQGLEAWQPASGWAVNAKGELYVAKAGPNICSRQRYCDYVLEADFKVAANQKSQQRRVPPRSQSAQEVNTGMEVQILDNVSYGVAYNAGNACGALYDLVHPALDANRPLGQWNHYRLTANDNLIIVELNGKEIVRADLNKWTTPGKNPDGRTTSSRTPLVRCRAKVSSSCRITAVRRSGSATSASRRYRTASRSIAARSRSAACSRSRWLEIAAGWSFACRDSVPCRHDRALSASRNGTESVRPRRR